MAEGPPVKEVKTLRHEGSSTIEEYERLNQDGTVTKIVTVSNPATGMKHYDVYRMDRSGIVRKVNGADQENLVSLKEAADAKHEWFNRQADVSQNMPRPQEIPKDIQPYAGKQFPFTRYSPDGHRVTQPQDEFLQLISDAKMMSAEQRMAVFNKYKEKLIDYGTKKLENVLIQKLNDRNNTKISSTPMTDEQKNNLVSYGVKKMHNLLLNDLNEELFFTEILPRYESEHVSYFPPETSQTQNQNQIDRPVSFSLQPGAANSNDQKGKPISFTIRPEETKNYQTTDYEPKRDRSINTVESLNQSVSRLEKEINNTFKYDKMPESEKSLEQQKKEEVIKFALQGMKNTAKESEVDRRRINEESYERRKNNPILQAVKQYGEQFEQRQKELLQKRPTIQYKFSEPLVEPKQVQESETRKRRSDPETETDNTDYADIIEYLGEKLRSKPREEMTNKKYDKMINKMFDEEEVFTMGLKVLRKMLKKRHEIELKAKAQELMSRGDQQQPRDCFEYLTKQPSKPDTNNQVSEKDSPKRKLDWKALLAPFQDWMSDADNNEDTSNEDNKPQLNSNQSEPEEEERFSFADLLSKVRKSVAQARNAKTISSTRPETSDNGRSYQSWRASGSEQGPEKEKLSTSEVEHLLHRFHNAFSQKDESLSADKENNTSRPYQAIPQQSNNNNDNFTYRPAQRKPVSFRIQPQVSIRHDTPTETPPRSIDKSNSDGNVPWWFDGTSDYMDAPFIKPPSVKKPPAVGSSFYEPAFLNDPLFEDAPLLGGNRFSGPRLGDS